ncbi:MAG: RNA polymerase sigma factor [Acidobacteria bacterium]|nr:RNA polymerase sigma factor [Acidobacteriota bacterium]
MFETAVREYAGMVFRIAFSVLRNHHDAEDATQETFMRVFRYRWKLERGIRQPKTWIARIAWRVAIERSKRLPEISLSDAEMGHARDQLRSQLASGEECALQNEMTRLLESLIVALPDQLRGVLTLSALQELSPAEIAEVLGTTEASVRSRVFRARQVLKEKLGRLELGYGIR